MLSSVVQVELLESSRTNARNATKIFGLYRLGHLANLFLSLVVSFLARADLRHEILVFPCLP